MWCGGRGKDHCLLDVAYDKVNICVVEANILPVINAVETNGSTIARVGEGHIFIMISLTVIVSALTDDTGGGDHGFTRRLRRDRRVERNQGCDTILRSGKVAGALMKGGGSGGALCIKTRSLVE